AVVRVVPRHGVPALQEVVAVAAEQVVVARPAVDLVVLVVALEPVAQDEDLPLAAAPLGARPASTEALLDELLVIGLSLEDVRPVAAEAFVVALAEAEDVVALLAVGAVLARLRADDV